MVQKIAGEQIPDITETCIRSITDLILNPFHGQMRYDLFIADDSHGRVKGFALISYDLKNSFCYLDMLATDRKRPEGGVGGTLYERVREESTLLNCFGIFFECPGELGNDVEDIAGKKMRAARLRFYEQYGARPIDNILYESISRKHYRTGYFLMFDPLGRTQMPGIKQSKKAIRLILEHKYGGFYTADEIDRIMNSVRNDPMRLRPYRYRKAAVKQSALPVPEKKKIMLVYNDKHAIHHIKERGYQESPVRVDSILRSILPTGLFHQAGIKAFPTSLILEVHHRDFYDYLKMISVTFEPEKSLYPDVFPIRRDVKKPGRLSSHVGYYCIDIYSPINRNAFLAARAAVDCALTGAESLLYGRRLVYALVRPPGHHAGRAYAGGFCYLNSTAIAANYLSKFGSVAVLDIDYHHGNGQQEIFYERADVLTISIHASPEFEYPYFSGYSSETGSGAGAGYNVNIPLRSGTGGAEYARHLRRALARIAHFRPAFLVIAFGLDTAKGDPTGTWQITGDDFEMTGGMIGRMRLPTLVVQEGGYDNRQLGKNAQRFFTGLWKGLYN